VRSIFVYLYRTIGLQLDQWYHTLDIEQYIRYTGQYHSRLYRIYTDIFIQLG
jgi:hypothetical protein